VSYLDDVLALAGLVFFNLAIGLLIYALAPEITLWATQ
jgi:hypothetical protein